MVLGSRTPLKGVTGMHGHGCLIGLLVSAIAVAKLIVLVFAALFFGALGLLFGKEVGHIGSDALHKHWEKMQGKQASAE